MKKTPFIKLGPPLKYQSAEDLEDSVAQYFRHCKKHKLHPGICGLSSWLGMHRSTLNRYERQESVPEEYKSIIVRARAEIEAYNEQLLYDKNHFNGAKFVMENNFNYDASQKVKSENINVSVSYEEFLRNIKDDSDNEY